MDTLDGTEWDIVISGTGFVQSLLALALSRSGKKVLHVDRNAYYGGNEAALSLSEAGAWAAQHGSTQPGKSAYYGAVITTERVHEPETPKLLASRAYSLALAPQLIYARSSLIPALVSSQTHSQLEFQAVGSWYVVDHEADKPATQSRLIKVPSGREDIFSDNTLDLRSKRGLMKFLRFVVAYEADPDWPSMRGESFVQELERRFKVPSATLAPLLALSLSAGTDTTMEIAVPRIAQHLQSFGIFGAGFSAVLPKWGGLAEIAQVGCRAGAVGGGVYVLNKSVKAVQQAFSDRLVLELGDGEKATASWLVGSSEDLPGSAAAVASHTTQPAQRTWATHSVTKSITVVSSGLPSLFPRTSEGGILPAGAVISINAEHGPTSSSTPVYVLAHSSESGECPTNQCVLYAFAAGDHQPGLLSEAIESLLHSLDEQERPESLWHLEYIQRGQPVASTAKLSTTQSSADNANVVVLPSLSPDPVLGDDVLEHVKGVWMQITGQAAAEFMVLAPRDENEDEDR